MSWKANSLELEAKVRAVRETIEAVDHRAKDARAYASTVNGAWGAMQRAMATQAEAYGALAGALEAELGHLTKLLQSHGSSLDEELKASGSRVESEKQRVARLMRDLAAAREAERTLELGPKKLAKAREAERLEAEEYDFVFKQRLEELSSAYAAIAEAERACATAVAEAARAACEAAAAVDKEADLGETRVRVQARAIELAATPATTRKGLAKMVRHIAWKPSKAADAQQQQPQPQQQQSTAEAMQEGCRTVVRLVDLVVELGGARTEGIFRLAESQTVVEEAMEAFSRGTPPATPNLAGVILKRWISKKLPEPLVPFDQYEAGVVKKEDPEKVLARIPEPNRATLLYVFRFLSMMAQPENVEHTKMGIGNLLTCVGPCLIRPPPQYEVSDVVSAAIATQNEMMFLKSLIDATDEGSTTACQASDASEGSADSSVSLAASPVLPQSSGNVEEAPAQAQNATTVAAAPAPASTEPADPAAAPASPKDNAASGASVWTQSGTSELGTPRPHARSLNRLSIGGKRGIPSRPPPVPPPDHSSQLAESATAPEPGSDHESCQQAESATAPSSPAVAPTDAGKEADQSILCVQPLQEKPKTVPEDWF
eukprot:m51a1_g529 hypothetical protein (602) ;mRNA; r:368223-370457